MTMISVVQVLRKEPVSGNPDYFKIIESNNKFFKQFGVEYLVYDHLQSVEVLKFIKNFPEVKYFRKEISNIKNSFLEAGLLTNGEKLIYFKSEDIINIDNVQILENIRPHIMRKDLKKISDLKQENFQYDNFNLLVKDKKTFWEKIKLLFM